jgi:DNA-binding transcriptional LysR family regulator
MIPINCVYSSPMLLELFETFAQVARAGNVSRAAEQLHLTQPAVSARLQALERDIGVPLLVRTPRGVTLSEAGRTLLPFAERAIGAAAEARQAVAELRSGESGELRIAAAPAVSTYLLPRLLKAFEAEFPAVRIGVRTGHTEEVLDLVLHRDVHLGIGRPVQHPDIALTPIFEDSLILVVAARHPFSRRGAVRLRELARERLILFDRASSYYELTSSLLRQAGVVPESVLELDNVEAAKKMVLEGLGVSVLPRMALDVELRQRSLRPVRVTDAPVVRRPIVAIRRQDAGAPMGAVAGFLATLEAVATAAPSGPG